MPGFRLVEDFGGPILLSALDCEVGIFLVINDVQLGGTAGGAVMVPEGVAITNSLANSIPVTLTSSSNTTAIPVSLASIRVNNTPAQAIPVNFAGTVNPVLGVVTVDNTNAEASPVLQKPGEAFEIHVNNTAAIAVSMTETKISNTDSQALPVVQKTGANFDVRVTNTGAAAVYTQPGTGTVWACREVKPASIANMVPVVVGEVATVLAAAASSRMGLRIRNVGEFPVAIGGAGIVFANAAFLIQPGETWNEDEAPGAAWYAICDAGGTAKINLQGILQ